MKRLGIILLKFGIAIVFLYMAFECASGPAGHLEPQGSACFAPILILVLGALVVADKWKKMHPHFIWASITLTVFLSTYRLYRYHKMNDDMQRAQLIQMYTDSKK